MTNKGSKLLYGDTVIWENPDGLGHAFIKLRKQMREDEIIERSRARWRIRKYLRYHDEPRPRYAGTTAETDKEIVRSLRRRG